MTEPDSPARHALGLTQPLTPCQADVVLYNKRVNHQTGTATDAG